MIGTPGYCKPFGNNSTAEVVGIVECSFTNTIHCWGQLQVAQLNAVVEGTAAYGLQLAWQRQPREQVELVVELVIGQGCEGGLAEV